MILYAIQFAHPTYLGSSFSDESTIMTRHYNDDAPDDTASDIMACKIRSLIHSTLFAAVDPACFGRKNDLKFVCLIILFLVLLFVCLLFHISLPCLYRTLNSQWVNFQSYMISGLIRISLIFPTICKTSPRTKMNSKIFNT